MATIFPTMNFLMVDFEKTPGHCAKKFANLKLKMRAILLTPGKMKKDWFAEAERDFSSRLARFCDFQIVCTKAEKVTKKSNPATLRSQECVAMSEKIQESDFTVALDAAGQQFSCSQFTKLLQDLQHSGKRIVFAVGGCNGLNQEFAASSNLKMSLGKMTLTQDLARVVLLENLFRGFCVLRGLPFDR